MLSSYPTNSACRPRQPALVGGERNEAGHRAAKVTASSWRVFMTRAKRVLGCLAGVSASVVICAAIVPRACDLDRPYFYTQGRDHGLLNRSWYPSLPFRDPAGNILYFDHPTNSAVLIETTIPIDSSIPIPKSNPRRATLLPNTLWATTVECRHNRLIIIGRDGRVFDAPLFPNELKRWYQSPQFRRALHEPFSVTLIDAIAANYRGVDRAGVLDALGRSGANPTSDAAHD